MKGSGDFSIGSTRWPGISKLIEECGEVIQVAGKLLGSSGVAMHWDGSDLRERLEEEVADVLAACDFVVRVNELAADQIEARRQVKLERFLEWHRAQASPKCKKCGGCTRAGCNCCFCPDAKNGRKQP